MRHSQPPRCSVATTNSRHDLEKPSRSQKKRQALALQELGAELASLTPAEWEVIELPQPLLAALDAWRQLKGFEARRRHMQFIGRLMRETDDAARQRIQTFLANRQ